MKTKIRIISRLLPIVVLPILATWFVVYEFFPAHTAAKTGRTGIGGITCLHCHMPVSEPPVMGQARGPHYVSPEGMTVTPDGRSLYVAGYGVNKLLEVDLQTGRLARSVEIPGGPHGVDISADGRRIAVSSRYSNEVRILDAASLDILETLAAAGPLGVALSADGSRIYLANAGSDGLLITDVGSMEQAVHFAAGNEPYAMDLSRDGALLAVINRLVRPVPPGVLASSELMLIDANARRVIERRELVSAHLGESVALSSDGSFALVPVVHFRNLLPLTQVARGAVMSSALALVETRPGGRTIQFPLDEVNAYFADPSGVVLTPDDRIAFVAHGGAKQVTVVDVQAMLDVAEGKDAAALAALPHNLGASSSYVMARIPTQDNPRALAISPDGSKVYVAERLTDTVAVIDSRSFEVVERINLGGPVEETRERRGERVFHDATSTFQGQFSCRSCHPDGLADGLIWDFEIDGVGRNLVDTRSLLGIRDTPPFKWNGKNPDLATQCGPRFSRVLMRSAPFPRQQLHDLVAYIESLPLPPRHLPAEFDEARARGRELFFRTRTDDGELIPVANRCNTCHQPPLFTDRLKTDVGTDGAFDTPHLLDVRSTAPYLHDGRAMSLEEIWTVHSPQDTHGLTNDLTKVQLNDLVIFLRSL